MQIAAEVEDSPYHYYGLFRILPCLGTVHYLPGGGGASTQNYAQYYYNMIKITYSRNGNSVHYM